jgi:hypothetical protein
MLQFTSIEQCVVYEVSRRWRNVHDVLSMMSLDGINIAAFCPGINV